MSDPIDFRRLLSPGNTENDEASPDGLLTKQSLALVKAFYTVEDPELRRRIVMVVEAMARTGSASVNS